MIKTLLIWCGLTSTVLAQQFNQVYMRYFSGELAEGIYSYNYLFTWLGTTKYEKMPQVNQIPLLYTLYEIDPPHPERLEAWLDRQDGIGKVTESVKFGGITVDKRERITHE